MKKFTEEAPQNELATFGNNEAFHKFLENRKIASRKVKGEETSNRSKMKELMLD